LLSGCSSLITYRPQTTSDAQSLKYVQGVGTLAVKNEDHEIFMYPTFKTQGPKQPTFTIGYANNSGAPVDFTSDNVKAYFRGVQVPIYSYTDMVDEIQSDKRGKQIALAILGGVVAGAAAYGASHQTYKSNYSGAVWSGRRSIGFAGSNTLRVYDPMSGIIAGAAVGGATGLGVRQLEFNAQNQEEAANSILQANTVEPLRMVTGDLILKGCCDPYPNGNDVIRFEVTANNRVSVFEFVRVSANSTTPLAPARMATSSPSAVATARPVPAETPRIEKAQAEPAQVTASRAQAATVGTPVPTVTTGVTARALPAVAGGQDSFGAEKLARSRNCAEQPSAVLVAKGPGFESYSVSCHSGDALAIRCEFGNCRVLQ